MAMQGTFDNLVAKLGTAYPELLSAFEWVASLSLESLEEGRHPMPEAPHYLQVMRYSPDSPDQRVWESHIAYWDVHFILEGTEGFAIVPPTDAQIDKVYQSDGDYLLWKSDESRYTELKAGDWVLCTQTDIHKGGIKLTTSETVKKAVFKLAVPVRERLMAIDIGGTAIKYGLFDPKRGILESIDELETCARDGGKALMARVVRLAMDHWPIAGVAVSSAGQIDSSTGTVSFATDTLPGWTGMPIAECLTEALGVPAAAINDVEAMALGEGYKGAARGYDKTLCLTFGTGIGGAILWHGKIEGGANGSAGEFGHMITHSGGKPCTCGGRGCFEQYAATSALMASVQSAGLGERYPDGKALMAGWRQSEAEAVALVLAWLEEIRWGLASLVHIFNPSCILLGGGIMAEDTLVQWLRESLQNTVMPTYRGVALLGAALGNSAGLYGASIHLLRRMENA